MGTPRTEQTVDRVAHAVYVATAVDGVFVPWAAVSALTKLRYRNAAKAALRDLAVGPDDDPSPAVQGTELEGDAP